MNAVTRTMTIFCTVAAVGCGATSSRPVTTTAPPPPSTAPAQVESSETGVVPVGQELDVRLQTSLSSETSTVEQRFEATTVVDLMQGSRALVPSGSIVRGVVSDVKRPGRIDRQGSLTLSFDQIEIRGRQHPMRALATQVFESGGIREEAGTAGAGAGVGAVVGGLLGGLKGAIVGAVIGAGGAVVATEGKDIQLPAGSIVRIRLDSPLKLR
jgi:hypothetical protein